MAGTNKQMCQNCGNMVADINYSIIMGNSVYHKTAIDCYQSENSRTGWKRRVVPGHVLRGGYGKL